jgi:hypothetical protein
MKRMMIAATLLAGAPLAIAPSFGANAELGQSGEAAMPARTIQITPETRDIYVADSETVNLEVNGASTPWTFNGTKRVLNLQEIVPGAPSVVVHTAAPADSSLPKG